MATGALAPFQLPILLKGTSDDDVPCPGYLFEEIASILPCHPHAGACPEELPWLLYVGTKCGWVQSHRAQEAPRALSS